MSFQMPATTTAASGGFSFGLTPATAGGGGNKAPTFSFGAPTSAPTATPTFGAQPPSGTAPALTGFGNFGTAAATTPAQPTMFGAPAATTATPSSGLPTLTGFGTPAAATVAPLTGFSGFGVTPSASTAAVAPATSTPALPTLAGFGTPATNAAATTKPSVPLLSGFGTTPATSTITSTAAVAPAFSLPKTSTVTVAPTMGMGLGTATSAAPTAATTGGFANLTTATKTTNSAVVANTSQMTFNQLEEHINKWTLELEEQEKVFIEQATQINAWDKVLIHNNQKILELNDAVQKVKNDQQMLEQELEFIAAQHKELEESITPLQKEFLKIPQVDVERSQTYLMVENLDTQLKQMSEDLKEIIDNLNEANKGQDNTDPIIQIGKILNAHMSSLQWIETSSGNIQNKLEDINKMHESFKRDSERSFRSAYYN